MKTFMISTFINMFSFWIYMACKRFFGYRNQLDELNFHSPQGNLLVAGNV